MPNASIVNPEAAHGLPATTTAEFTPVRNTGAAAIARGECVRLTISLTTGEVSGVRSATSDNLALLYGVADEVIPVGKVGRVCTRGFTWCFVGAATVAAGEAMQRDASVAGEVQTVAPDATTVVGTCMGVILGVKGSSAPYPFTNAAPCWVGRF